MRTTLKLTYAAIKMFLRNKQALFFTLFMPLFIMLVLGFIGFDKPQRIDVGLVVGNPTAETAQFVERIREFPTFKISEGTLEEELAAMDEGDRAIVLEIPDDLIIAARTTPKALTAYTNAGKAGEAQAVVSILNQSISQMTLEERNITPRIAIEQEEINVHNLRYIEFLLPGLIALSIMQMAVFSVAFVFTQFKEKGVLKRLLATPMKPFQFVASNAITRLMISVIQAAIFVVVGVLLFDVHVIGSYALLLLAVILGATMFLGLGFTISGLAKTQESVPAIANLIVFPMMFLGGTFFDIANMPLWLQAIAKFLPLTYFSTAVRDIMTEGAGFLAIGPELLGMVVWGAILITLATVTFRFQERDSA